MHTVNFIGNMTELPVQKQTLRTARTYRTTRLNGHSDSTCFLCVFYFIFVYIQYLFNDLSKDMQSYRLGQ